MKKKRATALLLLVMMLICLTAGLSTEAYAANVPGPSANLSDIHVGDVVATSVVTSLSGSGEMAWCQACGEIYFVSSGAYSLYTDFKNGDHKGHAGVGWGNVSSWSGENSFIGLFPGAYTVMRNDSEHIHANSLTEVPGRAATCTEDGVKSYWHCSCGNNYADSAAATPIADVSAWLSSDAAIDPAKGHSLEQQTGVKETCTTAGYIDYYKCSACQSCFEDSAGATPIPDFNAWSTTGNGAIPATGHTLTKNDEISASCLEDGIKEHWDCVNCDARFENEAGTQPIADYDAWSTTGNGHIPAKGHSLKKVDKVSATCTEDGVKEYWKCSVCSECFENEEETVSIDDLDAWSKTGNGKIPATGHTDTKIINKKDPTCTEAGYSGDTYCNTCKQTIKNGEPISAKGHTESDWLTDAEKHWTECTVCHEIIKAKEVHKDSNSDKHCDTCNYDMTPVNYKITSGANGKWSIKSTSFLSFRSDAPFSKFKKVQVDGVDVDPSNYGAAEGSTVINLKPAYLKSLKIGSHTISIVSIDGSASTKFTTYDPVNPPTGDGNHPLLWAITAAGAAAMLIPFTVSICRRKKNCGIDK